MDAAEHLAWPAAQSFVKRHNPQYLKQAVVGINNLALFIEDQHQVGQKLEYPLQRAVPGQFLRLPDNKLLR
jgi:hypothetical protein